MTGKRQLAFVVIITALLFDAIVLIAVLRLRSGAAAGYAGLSWLQVAGPKQPAMFGLKPGQVMMAFPGGPADRAGIRYGDEIVSIDRVAVRDLPGLLALNRSVHSGDHVTYRVRRAGALLDIPVTFEPAYRNGSIVVVSAINALVAIAFIVIGLLVFTRKPDDRRAAVFYAMVMAGALALLSVPAATLDGGTMRGIVTTAGGSMAVLAIMGAFGFVFLPLTLHLSLVFPHERPVLAKRPYLLRWVYGAPATAILVSATFSGMTELIETSGGRHAIDVMFFLIGAGMAIIGCALALYISRRSRTEGFREAVLHRPILSLTATLGALCGVVWALQSLHFATAAGVVGFCTAALPFIATASFPLLACVGLYRSYRDAGLEERRQVKWPLWGTFTALATKIVFTVIVYGSIATIMFGGGDMGRFARFSHVAQIIPTLAYLLIPISFAAAILKYRLMNIDVIIKKTVAYAILSGLIVVLYVALVGGLGTLLVGMAGVKNQTMVIASTVVVALVFVPLRNKLQALVDRNLFRQKYDYPQALRAIGGQAVAASDLRGFLMTAAETLQQALQNRAVVIFDRRNEELVATAKVGMSDSILGAVRISAAEADAIDRPLDPRRRALAAGMAGAMKRVEAALLVPIRSQGSLEGLVALSPKLNNRDFDVEDIDFLISSADQIAVGIDRIRMHIDEEDFEQARRLQQALIPSTVPTVEGIDVSGTWKPARMVGGDYYDLIALAPTQLAVGIGDVAGKGMPAALTMSALQAAVRASAASNVSPSEVCERVRRVVVSSLAGGRFVTFFYATIDTATRRIRYCNAGHNPPVLVRADGSSLRLDAGGPALSRLFSSTAFTEAEAPLLPGDRVVLFTDGVSEARDAAGLDFGEERLQDLVTTNRRATAGELVATIVDSVARFSGGHADDDLTLVAVAVA